MTHHRRLVRTFVALVALIGLTAALPAPTALAAAPRGQLVATLPDVDTVIDTSEPGSLFVAPGNTTVRQGKKIRLGLVIHFRDGGEVTYGVQQRIGGTWIDMLSTTRVDPADDCAMGGPGWAVPAPVAGKVRIRGFARQDGQTLVTPSYPVLVKPQR